VSRPSRLNPASLMTSPNSRRSDLAPSGLATKSRCSAITPDERFVLFLEFTAERSNVRCEGFAYKGRPSSVDFHFFQRPAPTSSSPHRTLLQGHASLFAGTSVKASRAFKESYTQ